MLLLALALIGLLLTIIASLMTLAVRDRQALTRYALARLATQTGAIISVQRLDFGLATSGVEVIVHRARVTWHGDRVRARRLRAVIGFGELARMRVMPLKSLRLSTAEITLASQRSSASFDFKAEVAKLPALAADLALLVRHTTVTRATIAPPGRAGARMVLDARIDANVRRMRLRVERVKWSGPPIGDLSASADLTIPAARTRSTRGTIAFIHRAALGFSGRTALSVSRTALTGRISFQSSMASGQATFTGSYALSAEWLELDGTLEPPANFGVARAAPLRVSITGPFSANPRLSAQAGPLDVRIAQLARRLGRPTPAITGSIAISGVNFAIALGPVRDALNGCADASCRTQRLMAALTGGLAGSLTVADAQLHTERPDLRTISFESPAQVSLSGGALSVAGLNVRVGAARFDHGRLDADLRQAANLSAPSITYSARLFSTLDLSRLDPQNQLAPATHGMLPTHGVANAQLTIDGTLVDDGTGFAPRSSRIRLRRGFVWLRDDGRHEAILLRADAALANARLQYSASASLMSGGTLALDGNYELARRALDAQISFHALDLRRWTRTLLVDAAMPGLALSGQAGGKFAIEWRSGLAIPHFNGGVTLTAFTVGSRLTATPVIVRSAHATISDARAQIALRQVRLGAGNFDLNGTVANFSRPKIDLSVTGPGFDLDAIQHHALVAGGHHATAAIRQPARPLTLHARVRLRRLIVHQIELRDFAGDLEGRGDRWEVRNLSAHTLRGTVKMRAAWDDTTKRLYVTGSVYRINARRLFAQLAPKSDTPVSGEFNARFNAGLILAGGAAPQPLCGDSTILMSNGSLGKFNLLSNLIDIVSISSWLRFTAPDLDLGMPYDHITVRMTLKPRALEVHHIELTTDAFDMAGHGSVTLPARVLDMHVEALPLSSLRGLLAHVPLAGAPLGKALDQIFAVRISVKGPITSPNVSPELFRNPLDAITDIIELPLDFVPASDLPSTSLFTPPAALSYRKSCSPYQW